MGFVIRGQGQFGSFSLKIFINLIVMIKFYKKIYKKISNKFSKEFLFDGDDELFKKILRTSKKYSEYGCGKSTIWVAENTNAVMCSVDTSKKWIDFCDNELRNRKATFFWIDCGRLKNWGRPIGYSLRHNFMSYAESIWKNDVSSDTVLIDGRFRVLCFFVSLKHAREGARIIFDDYVNRPHYHIIEEFIPRAEVCGRQALFIVPSKNLIDLELLDQMISKFEYVMD